jgi:hypothetical protein
MQRHDSCTVQQLHSPHDYNGSIDDHEKRLENTLSDVHTSATAFSTPYTSTGCRARLLAQLMQKIQHSLMFVVDEA